MSTKLIRIVPMNKYSYQQGQCHDLCSTCRNFSTCMYVRTGNRPVHHCEEYEEYVEPFTEPAEQDPPNASPVRKKETLVFYGLCKNCGNRMTCMNARPDRIIWHCEEYV